MFMMKGIGESCKGADQSQPTSSAHCPPSNLLKRNQDTHCIEIGAAQVLGHSLQGTENEVVTLVLWHLFDGECTM
jgi:hypothetical protein